jgi:hypothetical protein
MSATTITLEEVLAAAESRAASLAPETAGYLALAIGDATARLPLRVDERGVTLSTEGTVAVARSRDVLPPPDAARALRGLLARLLASASGSMPGLAAAARPRAESDRGVEALVEELEAALIPVNRAAAKRALSRLARETVRAKDAGLLERRATPSREPSALATPAQTAEPAAPQRPTTAITVVVEALERAPAPARSADETILDAAATPPPPSAEPVAAGPVALASDAPPEPSAPPTIATPEPALADDAAPEPSAPPTIATPEPALASDAPPEPSAPPTIATPEPALADDAPPDAPWIDEQPTTLDVVTFVADGPSEAELTPAVLPALTVIQDEAEIAPAAAAGAGEPIETPAPADDAAPSSSELRDTRPFTFGAVAAPPRAAVPRIAPTLLDTPAALDKTPPWSPEVHVPTLPMRFEVPRTMVDAAPARPPPRPASVAAEGPVAPAAPDPTPLVAPAQPAEPPDATPAALALPRIDVSRLRPLAVRPPPEAPPPRRDVAEIAPADRSDVDDLLARFTKSPLDDEARARAFTAGLKAIAELEPTALPPPVAVTKTVDDETPTVEPRTLELERPRRPRDLPGAPLPEPRRGGRASLAISLLLLAAGLIGTALVWRYRPEIFVGDRSPLARPDGARELPAPQRP